MAIELAGRLRNLVIRPFSPGDLSAIYDVCRRTGDAGGDGTGLTRSGDLLPDLYAGPYLFLEPERAFVVDAGDGPVGYVLGTADTAAFVRGYRERWIPRVSDRYPAPPEAARTADDLMLLLHHFPEYMLWPGVEAYPSHLHINILPAYQRLGLGRRLMEAFQGAAAGAGATGVHAVVAASNLGALRFYDRVGFLALEVPSMASSVYVGRRLP